MNLFLDSLPVQQDANTRISVDRSPIEPNFPTIGNGTNVIYNHTYYNCTSPLDNINFRDAKIVGSLLPLGVVCLMVILGNIMVITAIRITKKLRGATNMFIGEKTMKPWIPVMRNSTIARFGKPRLKCKFIALMWVKNIIYLLTVIVVQIHTNLIHIHLKVKYYYSQTAVDGKTFGLVFCVS